MRCYPFLWGSFIRGSQLSIHSYSRNVKVFVLQCVINAFIRTVVGPRIPSQESLFQQIPEWNAKSIKPNGHQWEPNMFTSFSSCCWNQVAACSRKARRCCICWHCQCLSKLHWQNQHRLCCEENMHDILIMKHKLWHYPAYNRLHHPAMRRATRW